MAGKGHIPSSESQTHSIPDADELIDEILATKGPQRYVDGLSEDNWEKVRWACLMKPASTLPAFIYTYSYLGN